jgi:hypothetical protein
MYFAQQDIVLFVSDCRVFVVALRKEIHVFDSGSLQRRFKVSSTVEIAQSGCEALVYC